MRLPFPHLTSLATLLVAALCLMLPATGHAAEVLAVSGGVSDNYKARYNADPSVPEQRTWLSMDSLVAGGVTWAPAVPASDHVTSSTLTLVGSDGRQATLSLAVLRGSLGLTVLRADRPTASVDHVRWGVLTTINDPNAIAGQSALVQLTMTVGGATLATGVVEYRHEPAFDGVASTHIEWNGPRGRWYIGGTALRTDWEPAAPATAPAASNPNARPRITKVTMPIATSNRRVTVKIRGRNAGPRITSVRFRIGSGKWSFWTRVKPSYRVTLPARNARWTVRMQLRDAAGGVSVAVARSVRCRCG